MRKLAVIHFLNCEDLTQPIVLQVMSSDTDILATPDSPGVSIASGADHYDMYRTALMAPNPPEHPGTVHLIAVLSFGDINHPQALVAHADVGIASH